MRKTWRVDTGIVNGGEITTVRALIGTREEILHTDDTCTNGGKIKG